MKRDTESLDFTILGIEKKNKDLKFCTLKTTPEHADFLSYHLTVLDQKRACFFCPVVRNPVLLIFYLRKLLPFSTMQYRQSVIMQRHGPFQLKTWLAAPCLNER